MQIGQPQAPVRQGGNLQPKILFVDARNLLQPHQFCVTGVVLHERGVESGLYFGVFSVQNSLLIQELASDFGASVLNKRDGLIAERNEIITDLYNYLWQLSAFDSLASDLRGAFAATFLEATTFSKISTLKESGRDKLGVDGCDD